MKKGTLSFHILTLQINLILKKESTENDFLSDTHCSPGIQENNYMGTVYSFRFFLYISSSVLRKDFFLLLINI